MALKKKILCLHQSAELYGSDRSFLSVVKCFALDPRIHVQVVLPCYGPLVKELSTVGITPSIVPGGVIRKKELAHPLGFVLSTVKSALKLRKIMRDADILYVNTIVYLSAYLAGATLSRRKRRWAHIREIPSPFVAHLFLLFFKISRFKRVYNSFQTQLAFGDSRAVVVYNGVCGPQKAPEPIRCERKSFKILLLGRINTWKGHAFAVKSLDMYLKKSQNVELVIVGDTFKNHEFLLDDLKKTASRCDRLRISFHPFTSNPSNYYIDCDVVLVPSTSPEPFGRVAVEAFSYGKPVIGAKHGGLAEIVTHEETGYLFKANDTKSLAKYVLKYMEKNDKERRDMSQKARKRYECFFSEFRYTEAVRDLLLKEGHEN